MEYPDFNWSNNTNNIVYILYMLYLCAMENISTAQARKNFSELLARAGYEKERVVITRGKKKLAALVPMRDLELLERLEDERDLRDAIAASKEAKGQPTIPIEEVIKKYGLK